MAGEQSPAKEDVQKNVEEPSREFDSRKEIDFDAVEEKLDAIKTVSGMGLIGKVTGFLGRQNPFHKPADPEKHQVILFDNIAYRPVHPYPHQPQPWQAEFVAAYFYNGRKDVGGLVSGIADTIGLDGEVGSNEEARARIEKRIQIFIDQIAPAKTVQINIPQPDGGSVTRQLGPSNNNGISSQTELVGDRSGGTSIDFTAPTFGATGHTYYAGPEGWAILSDIDDTIKVTQTTNPAGILRTTFADEPQPIAGMSELYKIIDAQFNNPAWFYLSASPYNLYPFLHKFIHDYYRPGMLILRDFSWMVLGDLLRSLTKGTESYKTDRIDKLRRWFPRRHFIFIGDSTQSDPESYAKMYRKYSAVDAGWVQAIFIRKATDIANMEQKNSKERFERAFKGVPENVWQVFEQPEELADRISRLATDAGMELTPELQRYPGKS